MLKVSCDQLRKGDRHPAILPFGMPAKALSAFLFPTISSIYKLN
jgi:hypothetical protein